MFRKHCFHRSVQIKYSTQNAAIKRKKSEAANILEHEADKCKYLKCMTLNSLCIEDKKNYRSRYLSNMGRVFFLMNCAFVLSFEVNICLIRFWLQKNFDSDLYLLNAPNLWWLCSYGAIPIPFSDEYVGKVGTENLGLEKT